MLVLFYYLLQTDYDYDGEGYPLGYQSEGLEKHS